MTCQNTNNISIRFPLVELEIRPYTVDFRIDRTQLDYLDAKFSKDVSDYLKPHTDEEGGALRKPQPVEVIMDGEPTHWMYFRPDFVTHGETNCWIELHDPQKHLKYTVVDEKIKNLTAKRAYEKIFNQSQTGDIIKDIEFYIPSDLYSNLAPGSQIPYLNDDSGQVEEVNGERQFTSGYDFLGESFNKITNLWKDYDEQVDHSPSQLILDSTYNFDLTNHNSLKAIYKLNKELGLSSWVDNNGILKVGVDFFNSTQHVASANDSRVWRYHNAEIIPPGNPIKMVVVNGGMIDAPNSTQAEDGAESILEFINPTESHEDDLIAQGVAKHPGVVDGKIVSVNEPNLSRDALEPRAYQVLANEITNNNAGSVEINPDTSGLDVSDWRNIEVGDFIQLVPAEEEGCKDIDRDVFLISGVKHQIDGGSWDINLDILRWAEPEKVTKLRYFSPDSNNYYDEDFNEIYTDNDE